MNSLSLALTLALAAATLPAPHLSAGEQAAPPGQADFFVATNGNDAWSGKPADPNADRTDGPFATLARARDAVRRLKGKGLAKPVRVLLRGGTYRLSGSVRFGPQDSGTAEHPITYAAYPGEHPVLSGAVRIAQEWIRPPADNPVWTTRLPKGTWFQDLYVDGKRQPRARDPNSGFLKARDIHKSKTVIGFEKGRFADWPDAASGFAIVRPYQWCEFHLPISKIDAKAGTITLAKPCGYAIVPGGYGAPGEFAVENVRAAIDRPGEWCLDRGTSLLQYRPADGVDPNRAEVLGGRVIVLVDLTGEAKKDRWVEHVHFRGLTFAHAGRRERIEWGPFEGAAVRFTHGVQRCSIRDGRFTDLGAGGVVLWRECRDNVIAGCEFVRTGDTPVTVSDYLGEGPARSGGNVIANNHIHHCGAVMRGCTGVTLSMTEGNTVAHNLIHHMPYIGIRLSGTMPRYWSGKNEPSLRPPFTAAKIKPFVRSRNNVVRQNHIHHVMQAMGDGGAIYFWGTMGNGANVIRNNLIEDVGRPGELAVGLYLDDECDDVIVRDNVVVRANWGLHLHGAPRNTVENNIFAHSRRLDISIQPEKYNIPPMNTVLRRNIFYMGRGKLGHDWTDWKRQPISEMNFNLHWRGGKAVKLGFGQGFDKDSIIADPGFVDPNRPEKGLKPDSPAFKLGFKPIDLSRVGPQPKEN